MRVQKEGETTRLFDESGVLFCTIEPDGPKSFSIKSADGRRLTVSFIATSSGWSRWEPGQHWSIEIGSKSTISAP